MDKRVSCNDYTRCSRKEQKYSFVDPKFSACRYFEPAKKPTNGDKIRNFTDEGLAEVFMDLYAGNKCKYCAYKKSGMCSLKPRHEEYDEGGWVEDEDCIRGMIEYLKKEVEDEDGK